VILKTPCSSHGSPRLDIHGVSAVSSVDIRAIAVQVIRILAILVRFTRTLRMAAMARDAAAQGFIGVDGMGRQ
jgi:hypothetical protein